MDGKASFVFLVAFVIILQADFSWNFFEYHRLEFKRFLLCYNVLHDPLISCYSLSLVKMRETVYLQFLYEYQSRKTDPIDA